MWRHAPGFPGVRPRQARQACVRRCSAHGRRGRRGSAPRHSPRCAAAPARPVPGSSHAPAAAIRPGQGDWRTAPRWCGCRPARPARSPGPAAARAPAPPGAGRLLRCRGLDTMASKGPEMPSSQFVRTKSTERCSRRAFGPRDRERVRAGIHGQHHLRAGQTVPQGQGDGAAARAQVRHARQGQGPQDLQRPVHQRFGVGARIQHARIHLQRQAVELLATREVGHGLAGLPARAQGIETLLLLGGEPVLVMGEQPGTACIRPAQRVQQQQLRIDAREADCLCVREGLGDRGGSRRGSGGVVHGAVDFRPPIPARPAVRPRARGAGLPALRPGRLP